MTGDKKRKLARLLTHDSSAESVSREEIPLFSPPSGKLELSRSRAAVLLQFDVKVEKSSCGTLKNERT